MVSWNTRELLERCLRSLEPSVGAGLAEVWVVDNGSTDGSVELVREHFPAVRLVVPGRNLGFGPAVNLVARETASPWVAPANADVELEPGALEALLEAGSGPARPGLVAPRLILPDGSTQRSIQPFPSVGGALAEQVYAYRLSRRVGERLFLPGFWDPDSAAAVPWATGAFCIVRREAWDDVQGFDERQWMYAEDLDLCWRLHRAGWPIVFEPRARVRHALSAAAAKAFGEDAQRAIRIAAAGYAWIARRRGVGTAWAIAAVSVAGSGGRAAVLAPLARLGPGWQARRRRALLEVAKHRQGLRPRSALLAVR